MDCRALLRPLGMARVLETLLSIVSFACTINFRGSTTFTITCPPNSSSSILSLPIEWEYPFWLSSIKADGVSCNETVIPSTDKLEQLFFVDFGVQAQFFVFVGVCSFIISLAWVVVYVGFWRAYALDTLLPTTDLVICITAALFWLCADCAWASAYGSMKMYLSIGQIQQSINALEVCHDGNCALESESTEFGNGGFGLTLGFVNYIMWILNAFLAYREQQKIKYERDRLMYTADAFRTQATPAETMDATSINSRAGFRAI